MRRHDKHVDTAFGRFRLVSYEDLVDGSLHVAMVMGEIRPESPVLVRVHVTNVLRDLLHTERPGMARGWSVAAALERIAQEGAGVVVLVSRNESPAELATQIEEFPRTPAPRATTSEQGQQFWRVNGTGSQILKDLGVQRMRLLSSPARFSGISGYNLEITEFVENP
jgi:3,4-dihydroxy 2-butanone 4-phosphate synthase/GTP cyclohydrolase II